MGERNHSIKLFGVVNHNEDSGSRMKRSRWTEEEDKGVLVDESENSRDHSNKKDRWSVDEHKSFLMGLGKVGKGNWNQIAKQFVPSRSSTQVATHAAEKFFGRHNRNRVALKRNILPPNESYVNVNVSSSNNVNSNVSSSSSNAAPDQSQSDRSSVHNFDLKS